jgi:DNA topoisomerase-1
MPVLVKKGPYGPYVQLGEDDQKGKPKRTSIPDDIDPSELTLDMALFLLNLPLELGEHPETGNPVLVGIGQYGPYVKHRDLYASLKKKDDIFRMDVDRALELLRAKKRRKKPLRTLGKHPKSGKPVEVRDGRYGPYVKHGKTNASLPKGTGPDSVTMEKALKLLEAKKKGKKKRRRR